MRKYRNVPTEVDGIKFPSKRQANRYRELKLMEKHGAIIGLELERWFDLVVNGVRVAKYRADFTYAEVIRKAPDTDEIVEVVEDSKGFRTRDYRIKKKLMKAIHGIEIKET